ncbi:cation:proton antiporter, partial [Bifidobacterium longum]|nr:cation:proton antiporter [Bifidobacterium longum]
LILMLVKSISLTAIARYLKYSWRNSLMLAVCLAQGGEFAFVILKVASSEKVIMQAVSEPLTLIVTLSMVLTPIAYWLVSRWIIPLIDP